MMRRGKNHRKWCRRAPKAGVEEGGFETWVLKAGVEARVMKVGVPNATNNLCRSWSNGSWV